MPKPVDTIAENALRKIITAYGRHPPTVTRLQAFAKAARLYNDIDEGRAYAGIPDRDREQVLNLLKRYAMLIRAEEVYDSSNAFYPITLIYKIAKILEQMGESTPNTPRDINHLIMMSTQHGDYTRVFDDAYCEIEKNPATYPPQTMREFLDDIVYLRTGRPLLKTLFARATGFMRSEFHYLLERFGTFVYTHDNQLAKDDITKSYAPALGPDTSEEFVMMMGLLSRHGTSMFYARDAAYQQVAMRLEAHAILARSVCLDLTDTHLRDMLENTRYKYSSPLLRAALINPGTSATIAIGMTRYYLERHGDKLHPLQRITIEKSMRDLYIATLDYNQHMNRQVNLHLSDEAREKALHTMLHETWAAWPRPNVDDIIAYYDTQLKGNKKLRFHELLESNAPHFDLHVTYYVEQEETVRKLRRNIFKNGTIETGNDAVRTHFLKQLATHQPAYLQAANFNPFDIHQIARTGRLFRDGLPDTTYNVDHIIDLHAGGTNIPSNLCLMPAKLNDAKNQFLLLQTRVHSDSDSGFWVLTLRPKQVKDGIYTPVLLPKPTEAVLPQPQAPYIP